MYNSWLRDLIALHSAKSFSRAAERRNISQPAFSRRIRALEDWVGAPLIQRDSVPLELSEVGRRLLPIAMSIIGQLEEIEDEIACRRDRTRRVVRIAAQHSLATTALPSQLNLLHRDIPRLETHVVSANLIDCIDQLNSGSCDIVICHTHASVNLQVNLEKFEILHVSEDVFIPVATPSAAAHGGWSLPSDRLNPLPLLAYEDESFLGIMLHNLLTKKKIHVLNRHVDSYSEALKKCVLTGLGAAWLPSSLIESEIAQNELIVIGGDEYSVMLKISVILPRAVAGVIACAVCEHFRALADPVISRAKPIK